MRIIVWGINYAPEQTGIAPYNTGLCEHLAASGHEVHMLTTFAYYPQWKKAPEDRHRLFRSDHLNEVAVHRCWHYVPSRPKALTRMIHEATFVMSSFLRLLLLPAPDVMIVVSPPLLLGAAAAVAGGLKRRPFVFHVQDMQPDAAITLGLLKPGLLTRILFWLERLAYSRAAAVSAITPGMLRMFTNKGVLAERQILFPNWMRDARATAAVSSGAFRKRHGIPEGTFLAVYSGNLGKKQGLDILLDAAGQLGSTSAGTDGPRELIVIAGDGAEKQSLEERVGRERLSNVLLLPLQPANAYREMLADADVCIVTQQPGSGALFFPSKLLTILAHERAVVAAADPQGELESAIAEGQFGWSVPPGEGQQLAELLRSISKNRAERTARAANGVRWVAQFRQGEVLRAFERELLQRFSVRQRNG